MCYNIIKNEKGRQHNMEFLNAIRKECNKYKNTLDTSKIVMHNITNKISFNKGN